MSSNPLPSPSHVSLGNRYTAAWSEINARITSRQTVSLYHAAISVTVASLILGNITSTDSSNFREGGLLAVTSCGLVALSWTFALWIRHNDATIGLLSAYCKALERIDDPDSKQGWPAWHNEDQNWIFLARGLRNLSDTATVIITAIATTPSLVACVVSFGEGNVVTGAVLLASTVTGFSAIYFTSLNSLKRKQIANRCFEPDRDGTFLFREKKP